MIRRFHLWLILRAVSKAIRLLEWAWGPAGCHSAGAEKQLVEAVLHARAARALLRK